MRELKPLQDELSFDLWRCMPMSTIAPGEVKIVLVEELDSSLSSMSIRLSRAMRLGQKKDA